MPDKIITPDSQLRRIQRRLEVLELEHLRRFIGQQNERIEALEERIRCLGDNALTADTQIEYWRESFFSLQQELSNEIAIGLTQDGQLGLVDRRDSFIRRIAAMTPEVGAIFPGTLAMIVSEARELIQVSANAPSGRRVRQAYSTEFYDCSCGAINKDDCVCSGSGHETVTVSQTLER